MNESRASSDPLFKNMICLMPPLKRPNETLLVQFCKIFVNAFKGLPGIGVKSAQRIVFNLIQQNQEKQYFYQMPLKML